MQSENKLEKRTLYDDSQVTKDYQDTSGNDVLYDTITLGLAALTGYGLLKTGALKPIVKPLLELANDIAKNGSDRAGVTMQTVKQWAHLRQLTPSQLNISKTQSHIPPKYSIFRNRDTGLGYDIFQDINNLSNSKKANFNNVKRLINGSAQDVQLLRTMIQENQNKLTNKRSDFFNTEIYSQMAGYLEMRTTLFGSGPYSDALIFSDKGMTELVNKLTLGAKKAQQEIRESGYKTLTLNDVVELAETNGHELVMKKDAQIDLSSIRNQKGESFLEIANKFFKKNMYNGNKGVLSSGAWKDLIIDPNIKIDKSGNVIDYRMTRDNLVWFANSLATDFGLPLVKFNPFSMLSFDKIGRRTPLMGVLGPKQYNPFITGMSGQVEIGEWLGKEFGENYKNKNVAVINGSAYIIDENGKLLNIGNNLKLHDI